MKNCELVIFDLDGTLLDTSEGIRKSVGYVIDTLNLPKISEDVLRTFIGPPMQKSFERVFGMSEEEGRKAADLFRDRYKDGDVLLATPYDGIFETIHELEKRGIKTAVATYKRQDYADAILKHFGFDKAVDVICGCDFDGKFTKKDIIRNAVDALGVTDIGTVVMVGDSDNDAAGAAQLGMAFIGVTYGFGFADKEDVDAFDNIGCAATCKEIVRYVI